MTALRLADEGIACRHGHELMTGTTLATRNIRDFRRLPNLDIREL